jgi:hypothetical protein
MYVCNEKLRIQSLTSRSIVQIKIIRGERTVLVTEAQNNVPKYNTCQEIMRAMTRETFQHCAEKKGVLSTGLVPTDPLW